MKIHTIAVFTVPILLHLSRGKKFITALSSKKGFVRSTKYEEISIAGFSTFQASNASTQGSCAESCLKGENCKAFQYSGTQCKLIGSGSLDKNDGEVFGAS